MIFRKVSGCLREKEAILLEESKILANFATYNAHLNDD